MLNHVRFARPRHTMLTAVITGTLGLIGCGLAQAAEPSGVEQPTSPQQARQPQVDSSSSYDPSHPPGRESPQDRPESRYDADATAERVYDSYYDATAEQLRKATGGPVAPTGIPTAAPIYVDPGSRRYVNRHIPARPGYIHEYGWSWTSHGVPQQSIRRVHVFQPLTDAERLWEGLETGYYEEFLQNPYPGRMGWLRRP